MAANQYGIDMADIFRTTAAVKGARTANKLSQLKLSEAERLEAERPGKEKEALERKNILTGLREKSAGGDVSAQQQLLALDPEGGPSFIDAVSKMDERQIEATQKTVDEIGNLAGYVLQGATPEEQQRRFDLVRASASPAVQEKLPQTFDPGFMELSLSKAMSMDKILENPKVLQIGDEDVVFKGGREVERKTRPVKPAKGGDAGPKSADESLMYRQSAELLGGIFDQAGNITNLDPSVKGRVQSIATEATKIWKKDRSKTRSEAVQEAARKFGVEMPAAAPGQQADPQNIRNYLLN